MKSAKFKVAFCHIPLFDADPQQNPGDAAPADKDPRYTHDYARWQRTCAKLWGPSFEKADVQLVITAHQHRFRYDAPAAGRSWAQIVGGGAEFGVIGHGAAARPDAGKFPTVIEGKVAGGRLVVTVHDVCHNKIAGEYTFG